MGRSRFDRRRSCRNGSRSSDGISDSAIGRSFSVEGNYIHIIFGNGFSAFVRRFLALLWRRRPGTFIFRATGGAESFFSDFLPLVTGPEGGRLELERVWLGPLGIV